MNFKDYEASGTEKFFGENNGIIQMGLIIVTVFGFGLSAGLPPILNRLVIILGLLIIASISILGSAHMYRYGIYNKYLNEDIQASAHNKETTAHLPIPDLRVFLIRSFIAFIIFIVTCIVLAILVFWIILGVMAVLSNFISVDDRFFDIISLVITIPLFITVLGCMVGIYTVSPAIVDQYIYRNDLIRAHLYQADEKPLTLAKIAKGLWSIIRYALFLGIVMAVGIGAQVGLRLLANSDAPSYMFYGVVALLFVAVIGFKFWMSRRNAQTVSEEYIEQAEQELIAQYGESSTEVQEFRTDREEYNALSEEEKKQLLEEAQPIEQPFSIMGQLLGQIRGSFPIFMFVGMIFACIVSGLLGLGAKQIGIQAEGIEVVIKGSLALFLLLGIFIFYRKLKNMTFNFPEELTLMDEAMKQGDAQRAMELADIVKDKIVWSELGFIIAVTYMLGADLEKAEAVARESIRQNMLVDEEHRVKGHLAQNLTALGAILIEKRQYEEAEDTLKQALQQDSKNAWTLSNLAEVNLFMKNPEKSLDYIERAIKANQQKPEAERSTGGGYLLFKAWALTLMGNYQDTVSLMREAFVLVGDNKASQAELHYYSGHVALVRGKITTANIAFQHAIDTLPNTIISLQAQRMIDGE